MFDIIDARCNHEVTNVTWFYRKWPGLPSFYTESQIQTYNNLFG